MNVEPMSPEWRKDYDALPPWVQGLVKGMADTAWGCSPARHMDNFAPLQDAEECTVWSVAIHAAKRDEWHASFMVLVKLAQAYHDALQAEIVAP